MRWIIAIGMCLVVSAEMSIGAPPAPQRLPDADLLKGIPPRVAPADAKHRPAAAPSPVPAGEDLGKPPEAEGWGEIVQWMNQAAQQLSTGETAEGTQQLQRRVVESLAKLAAAAQANAGTDEQQRQADSSQGSDPNQPPRQGPQQPTGKVGSSSSPRQTTLESDDAASLAARVWGQLPPGLQSRLRAAGRIDFLPGFELQTERYYRALGKPSR